LLTADKHWYQPGLALALSSQMELCRQQAGAALQSPRQGRLMLALAAWIQALPQAGGGGEDLPAFSQRQLQRYLRSLQKSGQHLETADAAARHRVRIAAKRLRYGTEFFQQLCRTKMVRASLAALADMQETLGAIQDTAVAEALLSTLEETVPADELAFARGYLQARAHQQRLLLPDCRRAIAALPRVRCE
jgi:CHAD domain-containing protein